MGVINQITVDNTTYDVQDLISHPILTQAQYNALEEQGLVDADKDYHISDGQLASAPIDDNDVSPNKTWSSEKIAENDLEVYSTTEQVIGTWTDGKPIYRRVLVDTVPTTSADGTRANNNIDISDWNLDEAISISGMVIGSTTVNYVPVPAFFGDSNRCIVLISSRTTFTISNYSAQHNGRTIKIIIEYTKTTD